MFSYGHQLICCVVMVFHKQMQNSLFVIDIL